MQFQTLYDITCHFRCEKILTKYKLSAKDSYQLLIGENREYCANLIPKDKQLILLSLALQLHNFTFVEAHKYALLGIEFQPEETYPLKYFIELLDEKKLTNDMIETQFMKKNTKMQWYQGTFIFGVTKIANRSLRKSSIIHAKEVWAPKSAESSILDVAAFNLF